MREAIRSHHFPYCSTEISSKLELQLDEHYYLNQRIFLQDEMAGHKIGSLQCLKSFCIYAIEWLAKVGTGFWYESMMEQLKQNLKMLYLHDVMLCIQNRLRSSFLPTPVVQKLEKSDVDQFFQTIREAVHEKVLETN